MKRLGAAIVALVAAIFIWSRVSRYIPATVDYRGEQIRLTRFYISYDGYKDDPDNLDPSENARVARLVESAPIARSFQSRLDMAKAVLAVQFPGYGASSFAVPAPVDGTSLAAFSIEIPRAGRERVFLFRGRGERYTLLDDFIADASLPISKATLQGRTVAFLSMDGKLLLERTLPEQAPE